MRMRGLLSCVSAAVLSFALVGCGDEPKKADAVDLAILAFTSSPAEVGPGEAATLSWRTQGADAVEILDGAGARIELGDEKAAAGSVEVRPAETMTWRLVARGAGGRSVEKELDLPVRAGGEPPVIDAFTATPDLVASGGEVVLAWAVRHAEAVGIRSADGTAIELADAGAAAGEVTVEVRSSTTYRLEASNEMGVTTAEVTVALAGAPSGTFIGPETAVTPGDGATLRWTTEEASSVRITDADGAAVFYEGSDRLDGELVVTPDSTTEYVLTATGPGGELVLRTTVLVRPVVESFTIETPGPFRVGDEVQVAWIVRGATELIIRTTGRMYAAGEGELESGSVILPIGSSGAFTLEAISGALVETAHVAGELSWAPSIRSFTVDPPEVTAGPDTPAEVTIAWNVAGADTLALESLTDGAIDISGQSPAIGSATTLVTGPTLFRLTATNDQGVDVAEREVVVATAPRVTSFDALPAIADTGEMITLSWETEGAASIVLERDGVALPPTDLRGSFSEPMGAATATYSLRAFNAAGFEVLAAPQVVALGTPSIVAFVATPPRVAPGATIDLQWQNAGGQSLRVEEGGVDVCTSADLREIAAGGCSVTAPAVVGSYTYTLHLESGLGVVAPPAVAIVDVRAGPIVDSLVATPDLVTAGQQITLTWSASNDVAGTAPSLLLEDDLGFSLDVTTAGGSATVTPTAPGARTYTLTASTPGTTAHARDVVVDVRGVPAIELSANPRYAPSGGSPTVPATIGWTTTHGASLKLYELAGTVQVEPPLVDTSDPATVASGSHVVAAAPGVNWYRVVVDNGAGTTTAAEIDVSIDTPAVSLTANKSEIYEGEEVTFTWSAAQVDTWSINRPLPLIVVGSDAPIDVPASPTSQRIALSSSSTLAYADVTFPAGFAFPWNGTLKSAARVSMNGWIGFDATGTSAASATNDFMPDDTYPYISLAPFWDALDLETDDTLTGALYFDAGTDAKGDYVVFHWSDFGTTSNSFAAQASLNFQTILWADGTFAYRYGEMRSGDASASTTSQQRADGLSATIGYQFSGTEGYTWSFNSDVPAGLSHKSLTFDAGPLPPAGSRTIRVFADSTSASTTTWTITGSNTFSTATETVSLAGTGQVNLSWAWIDADEPEPNEDFTFRWSTTRGTLTEILDAAGSVLHSVTGSGSGTWLRSEAAPGVYDYAIRVTGNRAWDVRTIPLSVRVHAPMSIDTFAASQAAIDPGQSATLSWSLTGAASVELLANGTPIDVSAQPLAGGSIAVSPATSTTYRLNVYDASGRVRTAETTVLVRTAALTQLSASPALLPPGGGQVTLDWTSTGATHTTIDDGFRFTPTSNTYVDISADPGATKLHFPTGTTAQQHRLAFPAGFSFPWYGRQVQEAVVSSAGVLSFLDGPDVTSTNTTLPSTTNDDVHLAVFWDALYPTDVHALLGNDGTTDYLVVQWKGARFSSTSTVDDVNFQVVLYPNGNFEYRYGAMVGSTAARGNGNSATIGFQSWGAGEAHLFSYNTATAGGLGNTGWRITRAEPASGQQVVTVGGATTFEVCARDGAWADCDVVHVAALDAGAVQISEIMARPATSVGTPGEYFEVRNVSAAPVDIEGWTIASGSQTHTIARGAPFVLQPGAIATLARSAASTNGGFQPDYVYGSDIALNHAGGDLSIGFLGGVVDAVVWNGSWFAVAGQSLAVEPIRLIGDGTKNDVLSAWCAPSAAFGIAAGQFGTPGTVGLADSCESPWYAVVATDASGFIDIATTGSVIVTQSTTSDYNQFATLTPGIGFAFPFFGDLLPANAPVGITQQGFITFDALTADHKTNQAIPGTAAPNGLIAAFWDELGGNAGRNMLTELRTVGADQVRIYQWINYRRFATGDSHLVFQVQLWSNGDIATILQHFDPPPEGPQNATQALQLKGGSATIGIEALSGTEGIQYSHLEQVIRGNTGVYYQRR